MKQLIFLAFLILSLAANSQTNDSLATKLFFELGFANTKVLIIGSKDTLFSKALTTNYRIGYAQIFNVKNPHKTLFIKVGKLIKKIQLQPKIFYRISIRDNELLVVEVAREPIYI